MLNVYTVAYKLIITFKVISPIMESNKLAFPNYLRF